LSLQVHPRRAHRATGRRADSAAGAFAGTDGDLTAGATGPSGSDRSLGELGAGLADDDAPRTGARGALVGVAGGLRWSARQGVDYFPAFGSENAGRRVARPEWGGTARMSLTLTIEAPVSFSYPVRGNYKELRSDADSVSSPLGRVPRVSRLMALALRLDEL